MIPALHPCRRIGKIQGILKKAVAQTESCDHSFPNLIQNSTAARQYKCVQV